MIKKILENIICLFLSMGYYLLVDFILTFLTS
jgi:hypothetical protein